MTVRLVKPRDPRKLPEFTLWRMVKGGRVAEARTRIVPLDDGRPKIRLYVSRADRTMDLLWSEVLRDGRDVGELAQIKQKEFEVRGWTVDPVARFEGPDQTRQGQVERERGARPSAPRSFSLSERMRAWRRVLGQMPAEQRDDVIAIEIAVVHAHMDGWQPCIDVFKNELNSVPVVLTVNEMQFPYATSGLDLDLRRPDDTTNLCEW